MLLHGSEKCSWNHVPSSQTALDANPWPISMLCNGHSQHVTGAEENTGVDVVEPAPFAYCNYGIAFQEKAGKSCDRSSRTRT